jgi:hypothetical protein
MYRKFCNIEGLAPPTDSLISNTNNELEECRALIAVLINKMNERSGSMDDYIERIRELLISEFLQKLDKVDKSDLLAIGADLCPNPDYIKNPYADKVSVELLKISSSSAPDRSTIPTLPLQNTKKQLQGPPSIIIPKGACPLRGDVKIDTPSRKFGATTL